jgi:LPS export ABC transporter protein LptC
MAGIFFSCENKIEDVNKFNLEGDNPDQLTHELELVSTDSGKVTLTLKAAVLEEYVEQKLTKLKGGFVLNFYNEDGSIRSYLSGKNAEVYTFDKKMKATDSVVFENIESKQILFTEELIWDQNTHKIFTTKDVKIIEDNNKVLLGEGLVTDEDFNDPYILKPKGDYYLKEKDKK